MSHLSNTAPTASQPETDSISPPPIPALEDSGERFQEKIDKEIIRRLSTHVPGQQISFQDDGTDDGQEVTFQDDGTDDGQEVTFQDDGTDDGQEIIFQDDGTDDGQEIIFQDDGGSHRPLPRRKMRRLLRASPLLEDLDLDDLAAGFSPDELRRVVDQAQALLESFYVHLPFKKALHGVDPIQKLNILCRRLEDPASAEFPAPLELHREMTRIFASVCDRHTTYLLPSPLREKLAFLGVKIEDFCDESGQRRYLVAHTDKKLSKYCRGSNRNSFLVSPAKRSKKLLEVVSWNGVPIRRAVEIHSEHHGGSNSASRHARGLARLTLRPLRTSLPPEEREVRIGYRILRPEEDHGTVRDPEEDARKVKEVVLPWRVFDRPQVQVEAGRHQAWGLDAEGDAIHQLSHLLFAHDFDEPDPNVRQSVRHAFRARKVHDGRFGYLRIFTFNADPGDLVEEFLRRLRRLPQEGLILDVRGNSGGSIWAAERILQFLTPRRIEPARFQMRNTPAVRELCRRHSPSRRFAGLSFAPWLASLDQASCTGAEYSRAFPITSVESCNAIGQRYYGPVVLITDALSYSATDVFAAGFQDHGIGPIIGVDGRTGGGGANTFAHEVLCSLLDGGDGSGESRLECLPRNLTMNVALRRALRVGEQAGMPLESFGVEPDHAYRMTCRDLLRGNEDLIAFAVGKLEQEPVRKLEAEVRWRDGFLEVANVETEGIERLDVHVDECPLGSIDSAGRKTVLTGVNSDSSVLELRGYELDRSRCESKGGVDRFLPGVREDRLVARRRLWIPEKPRN